MNARYPHMQRQSVVMKSGSSIGQLSAGAGGASRNREILMAARTKPSYDGTSPEDMALKKASKGSAVVMSPMSETNNTLMMLGLLLAVGYVISR